MKTCFVPIYFNAFPLSYIMDLMLSIGNLINILLFLIIGVIILVLTSLALSKKSTEEFIKPTKEKLFMTLFFFVVIFLLQGFIVILGCCVPCLFLKFGWPFKILYTQCKSSPDLIMSLQNPTAKFKLSLLGLAADIVYWYLLSSSIVSLVKKK
jgi:hypothetical protein